MPACDSPGIAADVLVQCVQPLRVHRLFLAYAQVFQCRVCWFPLVTGTLRRLQQLAHLVSATLERLTFFARFANRAQCACR